ncbi:hypothetical protein BFP76_08950 [Amylibacter kogurei]|uniref:Uncharacterized protein n=1 Tax=Paramylibacter kogurei TaxID=1889778 RepID=A0A2G5K0S1_9RHOB|nr:DUF2125 domain-containing protein [Amylibacter kogurei]PIB23138.1 hypothetical protein BFP76_08950 [Amylibacter kogurei]
MTKGQWYMRLYPIILGLCVCGTVVIAQNGTLGGTKTRDAFFTKVGQTKAKASEFSPKIEMLVDDIGWQQVLRDGGITLQQPNQNAFIYEATLQAEQLNLPKRDWDRMKERGLPHHFSTATLTMEFELSQPWSDRAFDEQAIERIELHKLNLAIADMTLSAKGSVLVNEHGKMLGEVSGYFTNWRQILELFDLPAATPKKLVETFLERIADGDAVEVKFDIIDSRLYLGAMPLANIPPIQPK